MTNQKQTKIQRFGKNGMQIHIPADVRKDSMNPLAIGDDVIVTVDGEKMIVRPVPAAKHETGSLFANHDKVDGD